ncbi:MAG: radical SAM protein [Bifidobacteriaceae bacterium]|jgi:pyruvate formate lyase activating enzyme|nr:radical SAM protein [Bifidobacteriaceae bacterium]
MNQQANGTSELGLIFDIQRFSIDDGPGIRTCVFLKGCPLRCAWCCNPESQYRRPESMWDRASRSPVTVGRWMSAPEVMAVALRDIDYYRHSGGGLTLSGGEFMTQPDFAATLIRLAHEGGLSVVGETSGAAPPAVFNRLADQLDLVLMDIKHHDSTRHRQVTRAPLRLILQNAAYLARSATAHVFRVPVIPGVNDSRDDAKSFAELFSKHGIGSVELLAFHQYGKGKYDDLNREYAFRGVPSLTDDQLLAFRDELILCGIDAKVAS